MPPLFIVLEGIDGSGKTTQAHKLLNYFTHQGQGAQLSPEPTAGPVGQLLRQWLTAGNLPFAESQLAERQMGYLFAADRHFHVFNSQDGILKTLHQDHCHVITPRYYFSSLAYNAHQPEDWDFIERLNQDFPPPDLLIYLDLPVEVALRRIGDRQQRECYEQVEKLTQVAQNYQQILSHYPHPQLVIAGMLATDVIHQQIVGAITELQNRRN